MIHLKHTSLPAILIISLCCISARAHASEFTGRISSEFYAYRGSNDDHLRPYLRFQGNMLAWQGLGGRSLMLHTSLRWTTDFADELPGDPSLFVYDAYVRLQNIPPRTDLSIGRQFVYTGAGSALMDGVRIQHRPLDMLRLEVFGGSRVSSDDPDKIRAASDELVAGARLRAKPVRSTSLGASWMLKRHEGEESRHLVGIDAAQYIGAAELYGRAAYNIADARMADMLARAVYRPGKWYVSGEYLRREPSVAANSIFTLIDFKPYRIARAEARRRVWRQLSVTAHVLADLTTGDDTWRTGLGVSAPAYSISWIHQTGYAGDNDGVSGRVNLRLGNRWECFASANLFRYRVQLEQRERSDSYAASAGARWRPGYGVTICTEVQYLRNAVMTDDGRMFLQIAKDFSMKDAPASSASRPDAGRKGP
ncbi:MAG: hypothetical protein HY770_04230 [Chitinivibrionia bacterium]|nr:hypothetical protein [Chitinivibrionia bacterium]